jgi:ribosomal protein S18 acetylase RimI-like enzyme
MNPDPVRRATLADIPQMVALAADRVPGEVDRLDEQLTAYLTDPETCAGFVVVEDDEVVAWSIARHLEPAVVDAEHAPADWYLMGVIVQGDRQRRGHGAALTRARLDWLETRADRVFYFTTSDNEASIGLHASFGFEAIRDGLTHQTLTFDGGPMTLYELDLAPGPV